MVTGGVETILGVQRDPVFGPIVMFGIGGIFVEALKDVTFRAAPVDGAEARTMIESVAAYPLLTGLPGQPPADLDALGAPSPAPGLSLGSGPRHTIGQRQPRIGRVAFAARTIDDRTRQMCAGGWNPSDFDLLTGSSERLLHVPRHLFRKNT